jgi:hypothetical protein
MVVKRHSKLFFYFYAYPRKMSISTVSNFFLSSGLIFRCTGRNVLPRNGNTGSAGLSTLIPLVGLCVKPMVGNGFPAAQTILSRWLQSETYWMWFKGKPMRPHVCMYVCICINNIRTYMYCTSNSVEIQYVW